MALTFLGCFLMMSMKVLIVGQLKEVIGAPAMAYNARIHKAIYFKGVLHGGQPLLIKKVPLGYAHTCLIHCE